MIACRLSLATLGPATWLARHLFHITGAGANPRHRLGRHRDQLDRHWSDACVFARRCADLVAIYVVEGFLVLMVLTSIPGHYQSFARTQASLHHPHPFTGEWRVQNQAVPGAVITSGGRPMTDLFIEPNGRATLRDDAGVLWRAGVLSTTRTVISLFTVTARRPSSTTSNSPTPCI
jgi:hypothetical protein